MLGIKRYLRGGGYFVCSLILAGGILGGQASDAATYYVATNGSDSNPGTEAQPWRTLQKAADFVRAGDTVRIRAGDYFVGTTWKIKRAATPGNPITYRAYGDGEVRITNSTILPSGSWMHLKDSIYYTQITPPASSVSVFQNGIPLHPPGDRAEIFSVDEMIPNSFYISGTTLYVWLEDGSDPKNSVMRVSPGHVVSLYDSHYTVFDGLTVEYGYNRFKDQGNATHHITYRNNTIRSIRSQGIQPTPASAVIEYNLFQKIGVNKFTHGIYTSKSGIVIRHNVFEEIAGAGIHLYDGSTLGGGNYQIYGNVFRKPRMMTFPTSGNRYYTDIIAWEEGSNRIYNNVFYGEGKRGGISLNSPNNQVYNNTFVGSLSPLQFDAGKPGNRVFNNIFTTTGSSRFLTWPANAGSQTLDYNIYFNTSGTPRWQKDGATYTSFSAYQAVAGETHSLYGDPQLVAAEDFHLQAGSSAINAGTSLSEVPQDFECTPRPQGSAWDIGADEFGPPGSNCSAPPAGASFPASMKLWTIDAN
jgi:Right handed beta helix region/Protein of unknown function (DUF1565)